MKSPILIIAISAIATGVTARHIDLTAVLSGGSGLVAPMYMGNPPQRVSMRTSFTTNKAYVYGPDECPPFVTCFDISQSEIPLYRTYRVGHPFIHRNNEIPMREVVHLVGEDDDVWIGDSLMNEMSDFNIVNRRDIRAAPVGLDRECAGAIGLGPNSQLLSSVSQFTVFQADTVIRIRSTELDESATDESTEGSIELVGDDEADEWAFEATLQYGEWSATIRVIFDPSRTQDAISSRLQDILHAVMATHGYTHEGLSLYADGRPILSSHELMSIDFEGQSYFDLAVVPDEHELFIVVGANIFESIVSVDFFPQSKRIRFNPRTEGMFARRGPIFHQWLVPVFTDNFSVEAGSDGSSTIVHVPRWLGLAGLPGNEAPFILYKSIDEYTSNADGGWAFIRVGSTLPVFLEPRSTPIVPVYISDADFGFNIAFTLPDARTGNELRIELRQITDPADIPATHPPISELRIGSLQNTNDFFSFVFRLARQPA